MIYTDTFWYFTTSYEKLSIKIIIFSKKNVFGKTPKFSVFL